MPTTTLTQDTTPALETVHQPSRFELWLATQPTATQPYVGRHRGRAAAETGHGDTAPPVS